MELSEGIYKTGFYTQTVGDMNMPAYGRHFTSTDTNAYLCQMWVQLDFDIIDLTFTKNGVETVIPVIMSPMDIAADGTPPLDTTKDGLSWWQILLGIIGLILIIWLLIKFAPIIVYGLGKVIVLPFKAIGSLHKKSKERRRERKVKQAEMPVKYKAKKEKHKQKKQASDSSDDYYDEFSEEIDWDELWQALEDGKL